MSFVTHDKEALRVTNLNGFKFVQEWLDEEDERSTVPMLQQNIAVVLVAAVGERTRVGFLKKF